MTENIKLNLIIPESLALERLDSALAKLLPDYSRTQIKLWLDEGKILINHLPAKAKVRVKGGEEVAIDARIKTQPAWEAQAIPLTIIHEDDEVIVINKPVGLVVHPGAGNPHSTLLNALLNHAPNLQQLPRAGIIHRLDKDTSGLLLIAKTPKALKELGQQLKQHDIIREYDAIVYGTIISGGTIDAPIDRHPLYRTRMAVTDNGKHAVTHYRVNERFRAHTRLSVQLETGRTHQIRVHMSHIQHPLIGDPVYLKRLQLAKGLSPELIDALRSFKRQALHACRITFTHPATAEKLTFSCDPPNDMQDLIRLLQIDRNRKD